MSRDTQSVISYGIAWRFCKVDVNWRSKPDFKYSNEQDIMETTENVHDENVLFKMPHSWR